MQGNDVEMAPEEEYSAAGLFSTTDEHTVVLVGQFPGRAIAASVLQPGSAGPSAGGCGVLKSRWEDGWSLRSWVCRDRKVQVQVSGLALPVWPRGIGDPKLWTHSGISRELLWRFCLHGMGCRLGCNMEACAWKVTAYLPELLCSILI